MRRLIILLTLFAALVPWTLRAGEPLDTTLTVSLLTCSPEQASYELYGHTALRVRSRQTGMDQVYNYGLFSFSQPHFVWRFVLGDCNYMVLPSAMEIFLQTYAERGSSVDEQVLNLNIYEANRLADTLLWNSLPENRHYHYDIFRSNCTTKARDIVEACIRGNVMYPIREHPTTFRRILHEYTRGHEWGETGNDLLLGCDVDTIINERDEMFAPERLMHYADGAMINAGDQRFRPLVKQHNVILPANPEVSAMKAKEEPSFPIPPAVIGWTVFIVCLAIAAWEWRRRRICWQLDAVLLTLQGVAGVLLTFMTLFSRHPGVASNWQVVPFNPLPLLFLYPVLRDARRGLSNHYHYFAVCVLAIFVAAYPVLPQDFPAITLPLALALLSRSLINIAVTRHNS